MEIFGPILAYQVTIFVSILVARIFGRGWMTWACLFWTVFSLVNLFFPPLIIFQLIVVWGTFTLLGGRGSAGKIKSDPAALTGSEEAERLALINEQLATSMKRIQDNISRRHK